MQKWSSPQRDVGVFGELRFEFLTPTGGDECIRLVVTAGVTVHGVLTERYVFAVKDNIITNRHIGNTRASNAYAGG